MIDARQDFALQCKDALTRMGGKSWELDRLREAVLLLLDVYLNPPGNENADSGTNAGPSAYAAGVRRGLGS